MKSFTGLRLFGFCGGRKQEALVESEKKGALAALIKKKKIYRIFQRRVKN